MLRVSIFVATVLLAGCPSKQPHAPRPVDAGDVALRVRIAQAEVKRAGGIAELRELATSKDANARALALRGLGRSARADTIPILEAALGDPEPAVVIAAATALGVVGSLDETAKIDGPKLVALLAHAVADVRLAAAEALGRSGASADQAALIECAKTVPACALALGRYGRRKIVLDEQARAALVHATSSSASDLRYAATYALAREHEAPADPNVTAALAARIADDTKETAAVAIAGLAKRKALSGIGRTSIERALRDADWHVAVEAARALAGADDAGRTLVATSLAGKHPHVIHEALRALIGKPLDAAATAALQPLVQEPGWTGCLAAAALGGATVVDAITRCQLPDHLKLPLLADVSDPAAKRAALRVLLAHEDPRVRGAGLGALAGTWDDALDQRAKQTIVTTLLASLAVKNVIVAGQAIEGISNLYEKAVDFRGALDSAIVQRAEVELDVELAAALLGVIEKHEIAAGLDACRKGLGGHPVRAKAAAKCLRALGDGSELAAIPPEAPPVDPATVIGRAVTWKLATSRGEIVIELRPDIAPWAVASIVAITQRKAYDNQELHRVVPNFVAQGGDPTESGWGGPGYTLPAEPSGAADAAGFVAGGIGMADSGPDSAGSQWFVMHSRAAHLDGRYTWIGRVVSGQAIANQLVIGDKVERATVEIK